AGRPRRRAPSPACSRERPPYHPRRLGEGGGTSTSGGSDPAAATSDGPGEGGNPIQARTPPVASGGALVADSGVRDLNPPRCPAPGASRGGTPRTRRALIDVISLHDLCCAVAPQWFGLLPVQPRLGPYGPFGQGRMI